MVWVDQAEEEVEEDGEAGAEEVTIDLEEASAWRRLRRCDDKF